MMNGDIAKTGYEMSGLPVTSSRDAAFRPHFAFNVCPLSREDIEPCFT
jgi:hypothetical protein